MFRLENRSCRIVPSSNTWLYTFSYIVQTRINLWLYQHGWKIIYFIVSSILNRVYIYIYIKYVPESPTLKLYYILSIFFLQIVKIRNYEHKNFLNFLG